MKPIYSIAAVVTLSACAVGDPISADREACAAATTKEARYLNPAGLSGGILPWGPCVGKIYDGQMNDLVSPRRGNLTFEDLSTGQLTRITVLGNAVLSVERL